MPYLVSLGRGGNEIDVDAIDLGANINTLLPLLSLFSSFLLSSGNPSLIFAYHTNFLSDHGPVRIE